MVGTDTPTPSANMAEAIPLGRFAERHRGMAYETFAKRVTGPFLLLDPNAKDAQVFDLGSHFKGDQLVLGRDPKCDVIAAEPSVSRHHAGVHFNGKQWTLTDLRSTNGTFLGERLEAFRPQRLDSETMFRIGDLQFVQFLNTSDLYQLLEGVWVGDGVGEPESKTSRTHIDPRAQRRTTQRYKLTRRHSVPLNLLREQKARPRPMRRFIEEVQAMGCDEFLKTFPHPFLLLLSVKSGLNSVDSGTDTRAISGIEAATKLSHVAFWILATERSSGDLRVGRDSDNDIVIRHPSVSRFHVRVYEASSEVWNLEDLSSTNGVHVDGEAVKGEVELGDQALIRLGGDCLLQFMMPLKLYEFTRLFNEYPHIGL